MNIHQAKTPASTILAHRKKVVMQNFFMDSTIWDEVRPRPTDIVIASCYKSGTTLMQQIINLLVRGNDNFKSIHPLSPWVELRLKTPESETYLIENLPDPRFLKTHLPFNALPYYLEWKYIYLVRDGRDVAVSLYNHCKSFLPGAYNISVPVDNGPDNFSDFWDEWLETGKPYWPFWENLKSWWSARFLPNVILVHYADLINNKLQEVERIARFLNYPIDSQKKELIWQRSSLEYMKQNWQKFEKPGIFKPKSFINKGTNGRWRDLLTPEQLQRYETVISQKLDPECAKWVKNGGSLVDSF
jgi:aryl sulfotransferase